jgi:hypothetical protein
MPCSVSPASSRKIISPAKRLPYKRSESEIGRAKNGTISSSRFTGTSRIFTTIFLATNGCRVSSARKPPRPFTLML